MFSGDQLALLELNGLTFLADELDGIALDMDVEWVLLATVLVFLMQTGFAMLCSGLVRLKNTKNILLKNVLDTCFSALAWWMVGYGLAFGANRGELGAGNPFIGDAFFFFESFTGKKARYVDWFFQFAFCANAATIVSGAVAERTQMIAYCCYSFLLSAFVYPVVVHWVWSSAGWLSAYSAAPLLGTGLIDFSGSGVVHMVGGTAALCGAWVVGPRIGRFNADGSVTPMRGHSSSLQALGVLILWVGWYGFNAGSTLGVSNGQSFVAATCVVTTTLAGASGAIGALVIYRVRENEFVLSQALNGVLSGLVAITAGCSVVEPWAAVLIGAIASVVYACSEGFIRYRLRIDDVVDAGAVHCCCGAWGLMGAALFASTRNYEAAYLVKFGSPHGAFLAPTGLGHQMFVCGLIGICVIVAWVSAIMIPFFSLMNLLGWLRVSREEEGFYRGNGDADVSGHSQPKHEKMAFPL